MITVSGDKNILITGGKGYLGKHLSRYLSTDYNIIQYEGDVRDTIMYTSTNVDMLIHFACPNDYNDKKDEHRLVTTAIDGTLNMIELSKQLDCKFVYSSTKAVCFEKDTTDYYANCKLAMENYISVTHGNYLNLRIPRVYDKSKTKGLMRQLRENIVPESDYDKIIDHITINEFLKQTKYAIVSLRNTTYTYNNIIEKTIRDIKGLYV